MTSAWKACSHGKFGCVMCDERVLSIKGILYRYEPPGFWVTHPGNPVGEGMNKVLDFLWECLDVLDEIAFGAAEDESGQLARDFLEEHTLT